MTTEYLMLILKVRQLNNIIELKYKN